MENPEVRKIELDLKNCYIFFEDGSCQWISRSKVKVKRDFVKITKKCSKHALWQPFMDTHIGKTFEVLQVDHMGSIRIKDGNLTWWFPEESYTLVTNES